jgi:hypothetical protein
MNRLIVVKNERDTLLIQKHFPEINLDHPQSASDVNILLRAAQFHERKKTEDARFKVIKRKRFEPGCTVGDNNGVTYVVSSIRKDGYVCLKGRKGHFSPSYLTRI